MLRGVRIIHRGTNLKPAVMLFTHVTLHLPPGIPQNLATEEAAEVKLSKVASSNRRTEERVGWDE